MKNMNAMKKFLTIAIFAVALIALGVTASQAQTGKPLKPAVPVGTESRTDGFYTDAAGKNWPIYVKRLAVSALPNATSGNVAHGLSTLKLDGPIRVESLQCWSGTAGATARTNEKSTGVTFGFTSTNLVITTGTDLSAQAGNVLISYCKTTD